jgi:hypothetical protein
MATDLIVLFDTGASLGIFVREPLVPPVSFVLLTASKRPDHLNHREQKPGVSQPTAPVDIDILSN